MRRILLLLAFTCASAQAAPQVQTAHGPVEGIATASGEAWLGLPYAQPPVGSLRWKAPRLPQPWIAVRKADAYGSPCMQMGSIYGPPPAGKPWGPDNATTFGKPVGSEDCLTLNIWKPAGEGAPLPVIVFIHGGAGIAGYSADPIYDGANLAAGAKAIVVTVNFRLNIFAGFLHASLKDGDPLDDSGNYGALDLISALRYVHDNIGAFGGDPANVTLMGQSAGAIAVYGLMGLPMAKGLFHKAIPLSGLIGDSSPKDKGYEYGEKFAARLGEERLLTAPPEEIISLLFNDEDLQGAPGSFADGTVMPADLKKRYETGDIARMPVLIGGTRDEAKLMAGAFKVTPTERFAMMLASDPDAPPKYELSDLVKGWLLPGLTGFFYDAYTGAINLIFRHFIGASADTMAKHEDQVWVYRFDWNRGPAPWNTLYGSAHAIDLPFVFGNFGQSFFHMDFSQANRPGREALSQLMMQSIGAFIRSGDPNTPGLPRWKPWSEGETMVLDATDAAATPHVE